MIKVMIVEDSPVIQVLLKEILESDPDISVTRVLSSAEEAMQALKEEKPDLITLDIQLPKMDGLGLTRHVMKENPVPIVVVSGIAETSSVVKSFDLLEAGALAAIEKPVGSGHEDYQRLRTQLISTVKLMSEIKLVTRRDLTDLKGVIKQSGGTISAGSLNAIKRNKIIAIGASTGGPTVIQTILKSLPEEFPVPIVIAQHIAEGFVEGFASWLKSTTGYNVKIAENSKSLESSTAYVCPDNFQTGITASGRFAITSQEYINGVRPSVSYLFESVSKVYGDRAIAILLSGMGRDGARELKLIKERGGKTVAQDKESSIVHGMPGEAIKLGAADHVAGAEAIADLLRRLAQENSKTQG